MVDLNKFFFLCLMYKSELNSKWTQDALRPDSEDYAIKAGLEDWLEALGPLVIPEAVAGRRCRKPWSR